MTVHNIALVFGPTLFGTNMMTNGHGNMNGGPSPGGATAGIGDVGAQNKVRSPLLCDFLGADKFGRQLRRFSIATRTSSSRNKVKRQLARSLQSPPFLHYSRNGPFPHFKRSLGFSSSLISSFSLTLSFILLRFLFREYRCIPEFFVMIPCLRK